MLLRHNASSEIIIESIKGSLLFLKCHKTWYWHPFERLKMTVSKEIPSLLIVDTWGDECNQKGHFLYQLKAKCQKVKKDSTRIFVSQRTEK